MLPQRKIYVRFHVFMCKIMTKLLSLSKKSCLFTTSISVKCSFLYTCLMLKAFLDLIIDRSVLCDRALFFIYRSPFLYRPRWKIQINHKYQHDYLHYSLLKDRLDKASPFNLLHSPAYLFKALISVSFLISSPLCEKQGSFLSLIDLYS